MRFPSVARRIGPLTLRRVAAIRRTAQDWGFVMHQADRALLPPRQAGLNKSSPPSTTERRQMVSDTIVERMVS